SPMPAVEGGTPNYYLLILKVRNDNRGLLDYMYRKGIPSDVFKFKVQPVYHPVLQTLERSCPRADRILKSITTVPVHPGLSREHLDYIVEALNQFDAESMEPLIVL